MSCGRERNRVASNNALIAEIFEIDGEIKQEALDHLVPIRDLIRSVADAVKKIESADSDTEVMAIEAKATENIADYEARLAAYKIYLDSFDIDTIADLMIRAGFDEETTKIGLTRRAEILVGKYELCIREFPAEMMKLHLMDVAERRKALLRFP